jgi:hypothetical protein
MPFAVVLDVPPVEAESAQRALATCNAALGPKKCELASEGAGARWYAVVRFDAERGSVLTIQLFDGNIDGIRVANSELEFKDRDTELERWASAGVVVAALVAAQSAVPPDAPAELPPAPAEPPSPVRPPPPPPRQHPKLAPVRSTWLRMDLGATGGSEIEHGALRFGPLGRFGIAFSEIPLLAFGGIAYTVRGTGSPDIWWLTGSLGFGVHVGFARGLGALDVRTEAVIETVNIHAVDATRAENAQRTRVGPRFGLDLSGYFTRNLALVAGIEAAAFRPTVDISVGGKDADRLPPFNWGLISAVRYDFR